MKRFLMLFLVVFFLSSLGCKEEPQILTMEDADKILSKLHLSLENGFLDTVYHTWNGTLIITNDSACTLADCALTFGNYLLTADGLLLTFNPNQFPEEAKRFSLAPGEQTEIPIRIPQSEYDSWGYWMVSETKEVKTAPIMFQGYFYTSKNPLNRFIFGAHLFEDGSGVISPYAPIENEKRS